jgi:thiol-disulfide isomerase/thioredoxin
VRRVFCIVALVWGRLVMTLNSIKNKRALAVVVAVAVLGAVTGVVYHRGNAPAVPPRAGTVAHFSLSSPRLPAPAIAFQNGNGQEVALSSFKGQVVLVNFWATWCVPCLKEMPSLDRLERDLGGGDFTVVPISIDRGGKAAVEAYFKRLDVASLGVYLDPEMRTAFPFGVTDLPVSVLIDRTGHIVGRMVGPAEWDAPEAKALIKAVIAER